MALLGALVVWAPLLALSATVVVCAVVHAWQAWARLQRRRRADWWASHPYERGGARAADAIADHNGWTDTLTEYRRYIH